MMLWILPPLLVLLVLGLWKFLGSQVHGKNLGREGFERGVRSLLILLKDGGRLHVKHRDSPVCFDFVRSEGSANCATVILEVPRTAWSEAHRARMHEVLVANNFEVLVCDDISSSTVAQVRVLVEDIWAVW